jgi:hypothetical protein
MSEHKDERWLDEQLQRAVNGTTPAFDAQAWKQRYATEFQTLLGRSGHSSRSGTGHVVRLMLRGSIGRLAIAAAVVATLGIFLIGQLEPVPDRPTVRPDSTSPAQMVSMISLSAAFRQGGMEGLDRQCNRALERLGPRPNSVSMQELLKDINGKG